MDKKKILILGAGGPASVNFMKSLLLKGGVELYGTDINKYHIHFGTPYTKKMFLLKRKSVDGINEIIEENDIDFIHPQPDTEVKWLSQNRDKIKAKMFLPKKETIEICQDKHASALIWWSNGLCEKPIEIEIRTELSKYEIRHALNKFGGKIWLRATQGAGGTGSTPVENVETGYHWIRYWRSKDWEKNRSWDQWSWMAQRYLPGRNIAWHSLWKNGELIVSQARERLEYIYPYLAPSGITGTPSVQRTINDESVNWTAKQAVLTIDKKPDGIFCVDLKEDENRIPIPTEINAGRFFTTSFFFSNAGYLLNIPRANMPYMYLLLGMNEEFPKGSAYNILPEFLYWLRHMDCPAKLVTYESIEGI